MLFLLVRTFDSFNGVSFRAPLETCIANVFLDTVLSAPVPVSAAEDCSRTHSHPPSTASAVPETNAVQSTAGSGTAIANGDLGVEEFAMLLDPNRHSMEDARTLYALLHTANSVEPNDVSMGGVPDDANNTVPVEVAMLARAPTPPPVEDHGAVDDVYVLVKAFDNETQRLQTRGSLIMSKKDRIGGILERLAIANHDKSFEIFCDEGGKLRGGSIKARHTFEAEDFRHGTVLVVQEKLSDTQ